MIAQLLANGIVAGCSYALVAFGFALIYNTTRTFHFAHGAVYTSAAYIFYSLSRIPGVPLWLAIILGLTLTALLGILIDEVVYRPLAKQGSSLLVRMMSSLATYMIIISVIALVYGNEVKMLEGRTTSVFMIGEVILSRMQLLAVIWAAICLALLSLLLKLTRLGKLIRAMRDDPPLIAVLGVNPRLVRWAVFGLGSALAGVAAILQVLDVGTEPNVGLGVFVNGVVAVIIGGIGLFEGVILGALVVGVFHSFAVWKLSGEWQEASTLLLLILFLLLRPEGIFRRRRRVEEIQA